MTSDIYILIVDDSRVMLRVMRDMLLELGFQKIDQAGDGVAAFEMLKNNNKKYGLVISDWNMEPMSGLELLHNVRAGLTGQKDIPFIMVTAENKTENVLAAKQEGVNNYIVKPFTAETLGKKIQSVLQAAESYSPKIG